MAKPRRIGARKRAIAETKKEVSALFSRIRENDEIRASHGWNGVSKRDAKGERAFPKWARSQRFYRGTWVSRVRAKAN